MLIILYTIRSTISTFLNLKNELHLALSSSIIALFSTVNRKKCIQQERAYHASKAAEHTAKVVELDVKLAEIEEAAVGSTVDDDISA